MDGLDGRMDFGWRKTTQNIFNLLVGGVFWCQTRKRIKGEEGEKMCYLHVS